MNQSHLFLFMGIITGMLPGSVFAIDPTETAVTFDQDLVLPFMPDGIDPATPVCIDNSSGLLVAGCDGAIGPPGADGIDGLDGAKGDTGLTGDTGAAGAPGAKGDTGDTGLKGDTGDTGVAGADGTSPTSTLDMLEAAGCAGGQIIKRNAGDTGFECIDASGGGVNAYGDGSAGVLVVSGTVDWTVTGPPNSNTMFTSCTINAGATLNVLSGTVLRCTGDFVNNGSIIVDPNGPNNPSGNTVQQSWAFELPTSSSGAAINNRGKARPAAVLRQILTPGMFGGSDGAFASGTDAGTSGSGGGSFVLRVAGILTNSGSITANGTAAGNGGALGRGSGGGAGGFIILSSSGPLTNNGTISAIGGKGGNAGAGDDDGGGGGGGGGILHVLAPNAGSFSMSGVSLGGGSAGADGQLPADGSSGAGGGALGGHGGRGGDGDGINGPTAGSAGELFTSTVTDPGSLFF